LKPKKFGIIMKNFTLKIRYGIYALSFTLLCFSTTSLIWGQNMSSHARKVEAGGSVFTLPGDFAPEHARIDGIVSSRVYGLMDEREICFFSYLAITWSKHELADSTLLPAQAYKADSISSTPITLHGNQRAKLVAMKLTAQKPCGRVVTEELRIVKFYHRQSGTYYAVAGFIKPLLSQDNLLDIASSLKPVRVGDKKW
jgi:hypothetical protein